MHTVPEPWLMLHLVEGLRDSTDVDAGFNSEYAKTAVNNFLSSMPSGKKAYQQAIRKAALCVYKKALENRDEDIFLDKTPRYYHIIPELIEVFPNARFLILVRNPIAVFASILDTNMNGSWELLFERRDRRHDIFTGPRCIAKAIDEYNSAVTITHYEKIVNSPVSEMERICKELSLEFEENMTTYGNVPSSSETTFVDPKSVRSHDKPVTDYLNSWKSTLDTPEKIHIGRRYIESLGHNLVNKLGYDYDSLILELKGMQSKDESILMSWDLLAKSTEELSTWERVRRKALLSTHSRGRGLVGSLRALAKSIVEYR
ncbi:hypothetical protein GGQ06_002734 [Salinibacter ruber]|nr:hypothetical protein [Salinibacter ruber]